MSNILTIKSIENNGLVFRENRAKDYMRISLKGSTLKRIRERFGVTADQLVFAQCITCIHLREKNNCLAYPNGIPERILLREILHDRVLPDQHGTITFTPIREGSR